MKEYRIDNVTCQLKRDFKEYDINLIGEEDKAITDSLNDLVIEEGWELHSIYPRVYSFQGEITTALSMVLVREKPDEENDL